MTLANKITLVRVTLAPLFFLLFQLLLQQVYPISDLLKITLLLVLLLAFAISELSDLFDGMVARKYKEVSAMGKLLDPFGDVFSRLTCFFCFYQAGILPDYIFILILWREICMLFLRQVVQLYGVGALPARWSGKVKSVFYAVSAIMALLIFVFQEWPQVAALRPWDSVRSLSYFRPFSFAFLDADKHWYVSLYLIVRSWLAPLSYLLSVLASWYSFYLYLYDFIADRKGKENDF